jgi:hypothetical protein
MMTRLLSEQDVIAAIDELIPDWVKGDRQYHAIRLRDVIASIKALPDGRQHLDMPETAK